MSARTLIVVLDSQVVGRVELSKKGRLSFVYEDAWRRRPDAYPLSLSLPLVVAEHPGPPVEAYLWGLLPDSEAILEGWGRRFGVSARNPFALLSHVGEDCAGAVQLVPPERLDALARSSPPPIEWLTEGAIAARLRALRIDASAWRAPGDTGQFSLAGAQPKTALLRQDGRWGVPSGRMPTTHILKPSIGDLEGHPENEHVCLLIARRMGLPAASSEVLRFEDQVAIVVERYDRVRRAAADIQRIHQEDMCQALGLRPMLKYQSQGGPGPGQIVALLRSNSSKPAEDVATFVDALVLSWLIAGTDAHAKNYSVLHGPGGRVRLAPLYDVASVLPYDRFNVEGLKLAMKIGGTYRIRDIGAAHWRRLARDLRLDPQAVLTRVRELARDLPEHTTDVCEDCRASGLTHDIIDRLEGALANWAGRCARSV